MRLRQEREEGGGVPAVRSGCRGDANGTRSFSGKAKQSFQRSFSDFYQYLFHISFKSVCTGMCLRFKLLDANIVGAAFCHI